MNVTREKERMLGEARKAALSYQCLVGRTTRIVCDDGFEVAIRWRAENFAHLCGLDYYADDHRRRSLPARRLYVDLLARKRISPKRVAPTGDANWLKAKADVIAGAFELDKAELVVESGNSRVRLYFGGSAWHLGLGRDDNGLYYLLPDKGASSHAEDCKKTCRLLPKGRWFDAPSFFAGGSGLNVTREKERMLGEARKAALSYQCLVGRTTRIVCDDGFEVAIRWRAENFAHLCGLDYYADDHRRRSLPARRLYVDLLARKRISPKRVAPTGDANWLKAKADVIAGAFELDKAELVVESGNSRVRLYFGGSAWHLGLGRDDNGLYYPKSLKKGPTADERKPGTSLHYVRSIDLLS